MIPIGNLDLQHLIGTLSHFTVPTTVPTNVWVVDPLLPDHVGLPHVPVLVVHLAIFWAGWVGGGGGGSGGGGGCPM